MRLIKRIVVALLILFFLIQFIRPKKNAGMISGEAEISRVYKIPPAVMDILHKACYDCHSNNTSYPWYAELQPVGWFLDKHVKEGKKELNFSEFDTYSDRRKLSKLKAIVAQVRDGEMPLRSYKWLHAEARLADSEKQLIIQWVDTVVESR
ncbi:MAG: heme-binding domain-containing protein [Chitinophagaceae bacterium]